MIHLEGIAAEPWRGGKVGRFEEAYRCVDALSRVTGVPEVELLGPRKPRYIAFPRQVGFRIVSDRTGASTPEIGEVFGGRDHTTILHGLKVVAAKLENSDPDTLDIIERVNLVLDTGTIHIPAISSAVKALNAAIGIVGEDGWRARSLAAAALVNVGDTVSVAVKKVSLPRMGSKHRFAMMVKRMSNATGGYDRLVIDAIIRELGEV